MSGVVLVVYWSKICPDAAKCNFSIIDDTLSFWQKRNKRVVLAVITVGHPIVGIADEKNHFTGATPEWVMSRIETFRQRATVIGPIEKGRMPRKIPFSFPSYWDGSFLQRIDRLASQLGRYDGHPCLSAIRISAGIMGEDNPTWDGLKSDIPGWSNVKWIRYLRNVTDIYIRHFTKTPLESDIDRIGYILGSQNVDDRVQAESFANYLSDHKVFLAMNGFDETAVEMWRRRLHTGPARALDLLARFRESGLPVGLGGSTTFNPRWKDVGALARAFNDIGATRLVLFGDFAGIIDLARSGLNAKRPTVTDVISASRIPELTERAKTVFELFGFTK